MPTKPSKPHTGPADFNEGPEAARRFESLARHILTTPKDELVKPSKRQRNASKVKKK